MRSLEAAGADVVKLPARGDHIDLHALFTVLGQREINEVHTEAGPHLLGALLQHGLLDELLWYLAPNLLGRMHDLGSAFRRFVHAGAPGIWCDRLHSHRQRRTADTDAIAGLVVCYTRAPLSA